MDELNDLMIKEVDKFCKENSLCPTVDEKKVILLAMISGGLLAVDEMKKTLPELEEE